MSKPAFFIVWVNGRSHRFDTRAATRIYAATQKALGHSVIIKPVGFES